MARNSIIYGLADEIYVAESSDKGGTWSGVIDGLRKKRKIYVRQPEKNENSANAVLIEKGAVPVDFDGTISGQPSIEELIAEYEPKILDLLRTGDYTAKEIIAKLQLRWNDFELNGFMKTKNEIELTGKKIKRYTIYRQQSLF